MIDNMQVVYEQLYKPLLRFVTGLCRNVDLAEDVVVATFSFLLEKQETPPDIRGWLFLTAKYELISHYRKINHFAPFEYAQNKSSSSDLRPVEEEAIKRIVYKEQIQRVLPVIEKLSPHQRRVLHLKLFQDCSNSEIAEIIGTTENHAKTIYVCALEKFRRPLKASVEGARNVGTCSYGACKKASIPGVGLCKKHLRVKQAGYVRKNQHKNRGWS